MTLVKLSGTRITKKPVAKKASKVTTRHKPVAKKNPAAMPLSVRKAFKDIQERYVEPLDWYVANDGTIFVTYRVSYKGIQIRSNKPNGKWRHVRRYRVVPKRGGWADHILASWETKTQDGT